jgi:RNA polymerase sigma-70 factor (ECF subfamily)
MDNDRATALVALSRGGDERAFEELVAGHQGYSYALAFRFLGNPEDAREVVQDAFLKVWTSLHAFDPARTFKTWLSRIVVNASLDKIRRLKRRRALPLIENAAPDRASANPENSPEREQARKELFGLVLEIAGRLPSRQRSVFILRDLEDLEMEEIASVLSISPAAVKSNLCHARRAVREGLRESEKTGRFRHDL